MSDPKAEQSLANLARALDRLDEALGVSGASQLEVDGTLQRFEFCIELFWKTLKRCLEAQGVPVSTPRDAVAQAFRVGWLREEAPWLQMIKDRNELSHIYSDEMARCIHARVADHRSEMRRVYGFLRGL